MMKIQNFLRSCWLAIGSSGRMVQVMFICTAALPGRTAAQCTGSIDLGNDTILCVGQTLILGPGPGYLSYLWDNGSTSPTRTAGVAGNYTCEVRQLDPGSDLVLNGNFSGGAAGFTSGYVPGTGGTYGLLSLEGTYAVASNATATHNNFAPCTDHTGGGNMLVVNGASTAGVSIWCETVSVVPGTDYAFSAWLSTMFSQNPAVLQFTINGQVIGVPFNASLTTCTWQQFYNVWNSGTATSAQICITNQNTQVAGNDFALDDISFNPFCTYSDTIVVDVVAYPDPDIGQDQVVCGNGPVVLDATYPGATRYVWNDGSQAPTLQVETGGTYWVHVFAASCMGRDSVDITFFPSPVVELGPDRVICTGDSLLLDATFNGASYLWQDGSTAPTFTTLATGDVWVEVAVGPCVTTDQVRLTFEDCLVEVVIPNVFSPNGESGNNVLTPIRMNGVGSLSFEVRNRWGQVLFTSNSPRFAWDGRTGAGEVVPEGVYYWTLNYTGRSSDPAETHGHVTLLR